LGERSAKKEIDTPPRIGKEEISWLLERAERNRINRDRSSSYSGLEKN